MHDRHYRVSGLCDDPTCDCRRVFGIPADEPHRVVPARTWLGAAASEIVDALYPGLLPPADVPHAVLTECMHCPATIETRTGEQRVQDAIAAGWEIDGAGDLVCPACTEARAEMLGDGQ